jgi:hypothetical protein
MGKESVRDNGGSRSGVERRQYSSNIHIPERRSGKNRRSGLDRRIASVLRGKYAMERRAASIKSRDRSAYKEDPVSPKDD